MTFTIKYSPLSIPNYLKLFKANYLRIYIIVFYFNSNAGPIKLLLGLSLSACNLNALITTIHSFIDFMLANPIPINNTVIIIRMNVLMLEKSLERK